MTEGKKLHAIALTARGAETAASLAKELGAILHLPERLAHAHPDASQFAIPVARLIAQNWNTAEGFLLVMAAGIAVRSISPLIASKYEDPAVVVFDPEGRFAVPLLSGHLGGANALANRAAEILGGQAVITTATDAVGAPAIEVWAAANGMEIDDKRAVAIINRAFAEGEKVALYIEPGAPIPNTLAGLAPWVSPPAESLDLLADTSGPKIAITDKFPGPTGCLILRPRTLVLGIGSKKGADPDRLKTGAINALHKAGWSEKSIARIATIDIKKEEPAILAFAETRGLGLVTFTAAELSAIEVPNPSERVKREVGAPGVAEGAALAASGCARLIIEKVAGGEWTLAAARLEEKWD